MNTEAAFKLLERGSTVLCAVSGGADSMCLLHLLWKNRERLGIKVCAAHYEHGLRGEESLRDGEFVESWCREREIPFIMEHGRAGEYARERGMSTEEAARELRYAFLEKAAEKLGCSVIATAHNADDNTETVIFNLARGSGTAGLRGIPPRRGNIIRPLLGCTREEIEKYLEENSVPHVEDSSNFSDDYSRNVIRHKIMPVLREINPAVSAAAERTAELLRKDEDCLSALADEFIAKFYDGSSLPAKELLSLHPALSGRVIRKLSGSSLSFEHTEAVLKLCGGQGIGYADIPGRRIKREKGRIYFICPQSVSIPERELVPGKSLAIPEAGITVRAVLTEHRGEINDLFKTYCFKYSNICGKIICTGRKPGDYIRPIGRNCSKSLKKLFAEKNYTQTQRDSTPVFRDEKGVLAVYGLAADERCVPEKGDRILRLEIEKI